MAIWNSVQVTDISPFQLKFDNCLVVCLESATLFAYVVIENTLVRSTINADLTKVFSISVNITIC